MLRKWSLLLLLLTVVLLAVKAAPVEDDDDDSYEPYISRHPETTTPMPPVNVSNKTLQEQSIAVQKCWDDARIGHGPSSADLWPFGKDNPEPRKTNAAECAKMTTYFEYCHCFISVIEAHGKTLIMRYFVYRGAFESEVTYVPSDENGF